MQDDLGTATELFALLILLEGEGTTSARLPDILLVIVVLRDNSDSIGNEVGRVKTNTKLANHGDIGTSGEGFHELLGAGTSDGPQVVYEILKLVRQGRRPTTCQVLTALVMPIPVSRIVRVLACLSGMISCLVH